MPEKIHNLPITGIASFAKYPICTDLDALDDADVCVMGIPYDMGAPLSFWRQVRASSHS